MAKPLNSLQTARMPCTPARTTARSEKNERTNRVDRTLRMEALTRRPRPEHPGSGGYNPVNSPKGRSPASTDARNNAPRCAACRTRMEQSLGLPGGRMSAERSFRGGVARCFRRRRQERRADAQEVSNSSAVSISVGRPGVLLGRAAGLGFDLGMEARAATLAEEALTTAAIEGVAVDPRAVRSSVARRLGVPSAGVPVADRDADGLVEMLIDAHPARRGTCREREGGRRISALRRARPRLLGFERAPDTR